MSSRPSRGAARLAAILDALPDALLLVNANGTVVNANSIALEFFETPGTALIGRGLLDLLPAFDSKRIPGSMRRPDEEVEGRQPPTRMIARRTDGEEFPVEVTSANLEDGRTPYESSFEAAYADHGNSYTGNELLMLVVRDLTGTLDTEAELARQQRQTEMILRAAAEGVVGTDVDGRVVLVNPAAASILGHRASDLGGQPLHPLVHHSRADGTPLPYEETPLADTLRSGRKHRVRGQVLWAKDGRPVPVDMTTAPVRDGEQLVGAVLTFTDRSSFDALEARHEQLLAVVDTALRGPLDELRRELGGLAADPAGQLWPEANQVLHYLSAGYARMTTLMDNVLSFHALETGRESLAKEQVALDAVISAGVEGAVELVGPGRVQFAVHAPPIQAVVDARLLSLAIAHLVADVAGVDATGNAIRGGGGGSTVVVAAAKRGKGADAVVRIEVRGPHPGGSPVHQPVVRGVVTRHGGVLQTHELPGGGANGSAFVLEVPVGDVDESLVPPAPEPEPDAEQPAPDAADAASGPDTGSAEAVPATPTGRRARRALRRVDEPSDGVGTGTDGGSETGGETAGQGVAGLIPEQGNPVDVPPGTGRRARRARPGPTDAPQRPDVVPPGGVPARPAQGAEPQRRAPFALPPAAADRAPAAPDRPAEGAPVDRPGGEGHPGAPPVGDRPTGRRRKPAPPGEPTDPTAPGRAPVPDGGAAGSPEGRGPDQHSRGPDDYGHGPGHHGAESGHAGPAAGGHGALEPARKDPGAGHPVVARSPILGGGPPSHPEPSSSPTQPAPGGDPHAQSAPGAGVSVRTLGQGVPFARRAADSGEHAVPTTPQSVPPHPAAPEAPATGPAAPTGSSTPAAGTGRRRKLAAPPAEGERRPGASPPGTPGTAAPAPGAPDAPASQVPGRPHPGTPPPAHPPAPARQFAISAPEAGADEGPEPLDGPNGAVEVRESGAHTPPHPIDVDDELPPEPLDNPRRLLVWPEPDVSTQQALTDRGYRPVIVHSREEVDAQMAAYPAALFVDPLTGPITRTALQSLRQAAVAAEVPVLVTAGLGQASREAAYGADPAVLLKALAPRDSDQHPPRVLLVEEQEVIAQAFGATLERRGMQVTHAPTDSEAAAIAARVRPNLVVMDLRQIRRRRAGIIDWLRVNGLLNRTPFVVYTSAAMDPAELGLLASGETVLFLAERSTSPDVQSRIVDLLAKIGAN
ncbi:hypothetical protein GCM10023347_04760 [Streptomyces chumphonensis]|uniref:PAS domain-containing protein n=1 Tax=Streptomyces chumphonensis TaxID=1214925 RepID=A0A927F0F1_9ACTN|nr:PAS domain-containing protein [Streptomyces chumphonensis]MBD3933108.1 PAS domain-containing protein [Streptomyces chumphonensis]